MIILLNNSLYCMTPTTNSINPKDNDVEVMETEQFFIAGRTLRFIQEYMDGLSEAGLDIDHVIREYSRKGGQSPFDTIDKMINGSVKGIYLFIEKDFKKEEDIVWRALAISKHGVDIAKVSCGDSTCLAPHPDYAFKGYAMTKTIIGKYKHGENDLDLVKSFIKDTSPQLKHVTELRQVFQFSCDKEKGVTFKRIKV